MADYDLIYPGLRIDDVLETAYELQQQGYIFRGVASEFSGTPTERTWLITGEGSTGYGFTTAVPKGCVGICLFNGSTWSGKVVRVVTLDAAPTSGSTNAVQSGAVYSMVNTIATSISNALDSLTFQETTISGDEGFKLVESLLMTSQGVTDILTSFTILAATTSKAGLLSASDKAKLDAILTNIRSMVVTDTTLTPNQGTELTESLKWTVGGFQEVISAFTILAATTSKAGLMSAEDKTKLNTLFADGYKFAGIAVPSSTPMSTTAKIFYIATQAGTYTLFGDITLTDGINVLMYSGSAWSAAQIVEYDDIPTENSKNLVPSGNIFTALQKRVNQAEMDYVVNREQQYNARTNIEAKVIDGTPDPFVLNRVSPDYQLYNSDIVDNLWVTAQNGYSVCYFSLKKGETIQLKVKNTSSGGGKSFRGYWFTTKAIFNSTSFENKMVFSIQILANDDNYRYIEYTAKEDGYLYVRHVIMSNVDFVASKFADFSDVCNYVEEKFNPIPLIKLKAIDCNPDSAYYGDAIDIGDTTSDDTTNGCTDFVDIHEYKYLKFRLFQGTNNTLNNATYGNLFYDSSKEPLSVISTWQRVGSPNSGFAFCKVPDGAYYVRLSNYSSTKRGDNYFIGADLFGYKTLKTAYDNTEEAKIESLQSLYQQGIKTNTVTLVPQTQNVYRYYVNVFNSAKPVTYSTTRISYVPELYTIGGTKLTVHYTGTGTKSLRICQYSFIPLGTYITEFKVDKYISVDTFPSSVSEEFTGTAEVTLDKNCKRVIIFLTSGTTIQDSISPFDVLDYITDVEIEQQDAYIEGEVTKENDDITDIVRQSRFVADSGSVSETALTLLHITDIHEDYVAVSRAKDYYNGNPSLTNEILCTGDIPQYQPGSEEDSSSPISVWKNDEFSGMCLFTLGNHDGATYSGSAYIWDGKGKDWDFINYFADHISNLGYIMPDGYDDPESPNYHACFWHKDYSAQKIRLVGIDCMHKFEGKTDPSTGEITIDVTGSTNEQEKWLAGILNETLDSSKDAYGYSVVFACHYPIDAFNGYNEEWNETKHRFDYNKKSNGGIVMSYKNDAPVNFHLESTLSLTPVAAMRLRNSNGYNNIADIVEAWRTNGGKYVAWLCGHNHRDYMFYPTDYPNLLNISCDQAGTLRPSHTGVRDNAYNDSNVFNIVTIDTQNGLIKLIRSGYTMNHLLNSHIYMCYDYINKKVLNEG